MLGNTIAHQLSCSNAMFTDKNPLHATSVLYDAAVVGILNLKGENLFH